MMGVEWIISDHCNEFQTIIAAIFTKTLADVNATLGSEVRLKCAVSDPMVACKWYKNGVLREDGIVGEDGYHRSLHFPSISQDNEGEYKCKIGSESTKAKLKIQGMQQLILVYHS